MLKSQVPVYLCSLAFIVALPSAANPGLPESEAGKTLVYSSASGKKTHPYNKIDLPLPGQQGMKFVHNYIRNNGQCLRTVEKRSEGPFTIIDSVLTRYGLPLELKYLAVIESELKPTAVSRVGAKGPWQLMPATAHDLGLKINRRGDERKDYYKSTRAAAKYLRDLHKAFGDWLLVLAAYNGGPVPVYRAIRKAHSRNFWVLQRYLPAESRLHVKKFISTAYYFENLNNASPANNDASSVNYACLKTQTSKTPADDEFSRVMKESAQSFNSPNNAMKADY